MLARGQGYHVGIPYTAGFYPDLAPLHLEAALLFAGFKANVARPGARYCELGCGYGLTTLILAASNPQMSFVGVDFNPTHIAAAASLAESAHLSNIRFIEASFDEMLEHRYADMEEFDVIALHGVYSWVAPSIRQAIVRFVGAKLKTGGALYVSYHAAPGWMPRAPLQRLLFESAKRNPTEPRIATASALRFAKTLKEAGAFYFRANPQAGAFLEAMEGKDLTYLVHEHLNESWSALYHADVVEDFAATTLSYACSSNIADDLDETSVPVTAHDVLAGISDGTWRETVKDFLVERSFRRDIFVRGPIKLTSAQKLKELERTFVLIVPRSVATTRIPISMGTVEGRSDLYDEVLDLLARGPIRLSQLLAQATGAARTPQPLLHALALLVHSGQVKMIRNDPNVEPAPARRLNLALAREIEGGRPFHVLAAAGLGTGVPAELSDFGFILTSERGLALEASGIAKATWEMIEARRFVQRRMDGCSRPSRRCSTTLTDAADRLLTTKRGILEVLRV